MTPMSSSSSHNSSGRRRPAANAFRRRPLVRSNSSLLGTIKNLVTAPLAWFATAEDFEDSPDLKGKRRRHPAPTSVAAPDDSEGAPRPKRVRVKSPDSQIQFHPEPQYAAPAYSQPQLGYLDPPVSVFNNHSNFYRSNSVNIAAPTLNQFNPSTRSGLSRTMSIDPPQSSTPFSRDISMNFTPLDRDTSMEPSFIRKSSSIPRDLSMPLPAVRSSFRMRTSLTPQPAQPREASEPPPLSTLAQKPVFVRPPHDSHQRLSSQPSTSTLGSLVESRRSTRSPMRQHSSLLFGSGSQSQAGELSSTRQPAPAERALHELDIYKTPLLPTRTRLRSSASSPPDSNISKASDPSDMFRPRRSSQLLLMRDDRRASASERKSSYGFLETEEPKEKEGKAKVNETKPYAGEGGMKKLLARRLKEVEDEGGEDTEATRADDPARSPDESRPETSQPSRRPPAPSDWQKSLSSQPASSGSSLRVGRIKTSRAHLARPSKPTPARKFSAVFEDDNDGNGNGDDERMDDGEDLEQRKERQDLEEVARRLPAFEVPAGFSFAKAPNAKPVEHDPNAKDPPIAALPFSFGKPSVASEPIVPQSVPEVASAPTPSFALSSEPGSKAEAPNVAEKAVEPENPSSITNAVPNFFASSKLLSQASAVNILPPAISSFGAPSPTPLASAFPDSVTTPKPTSSMVFTSTPAPAPSFTPTPTPIKDTENPLWEGDSGKHKSAPHTSLFGAKLNGDGQSSLFGAKINGEGQAASGKTEEHPSTSVFGGSIFSAAKKDEATTTSIFDTSKPSATSGFTFGAPVAGGGTSASSANTLELPAASFGSTSGTTSTVAVEPEAPKASLFAFGQAASTPATDAAKPSMFGVPAPATNPFGKRACQALACNVVSFRIRRNYERANDRGHQQACHCSSLQFRIIYCVGTYPCEQQCLFVWHQHR
ncbi:hypothetical protein B0H19DRAFT_256129 [Mycena capillaripes]|nr:hypothetical protein B0H19DRAFT_256129 [Mycena capillaripes]